MDLTTIKAKSARRIFPHQSATLDDKVYFLELGGSQRQEFLKRANDAADVGSFGAGAYVLAVSLCNKDGDLLYKSISLDEAIQDIVGWRGDILEELTMAAFHLNAMGAEGIEAERGN